VLSGSGRAHLRDRDDILLRAEDLTVEFPVKGGRVVHAVSDVSLDVARGETLCLVGESGCGKSTTGRSLVLLPPPTSGRIQLEDRELTGMRRAELRQLRPKFQLIYQDPISSLNPRRTARQLIEEPLQIWKVGSKKGRNATADSLLDAVGLDPSVVGDRRPHEFSGGQCQRISIARALVLDPQLLVCDEPVSALDVSVQAQVLNLLMDMKREYEITLVFISHDLAVVRAIADRVAVMYLGKLCEVGTPSELFAAPAHPYTAALLSAVPRLDPDGQAPTAQVLAGDLPSPIDPPSGCRFRTRCPRAVALCAEVEPVMRRVSGETDRYVACHLPLVEAADDSVPVSLPDRSGAAPAPMAGGANS
jgi:peptide/nickel transport system ATP-binding protein